MALKILFVEHSKSAGKFAFEFIKEEISSEYTWTFTINETVEFIKNNPNTELVVFNGTGVTGSEEDHAILHNSTNAYNNEFGELVTPFGIQGEFIKKYLPNAKTVLFSGFPRLKTKAENLGIIFFSKPIDPDEYFREIKKIL